MAGKRFQMFDEEFQLLAEILPMLASVTKNPDDETAEQFIANHDRFLSLDEMVKEKLADLETARRIQSIGKNFSLELSQMSDIARAVRSFYFNEVKTEEFPKLFAKEMGVDSKTAEAISKIVIEKIINDETVQKNYEAQFEYINFRDAVKQHELLGEQLITSNSIKIKGFPDPVRPSIKNWLSDYTMNLGYESHDSMKRGSYLFQNENTKSLNSSDRQKLGYVLKAFDENSSVKVNVDRKEIIIPAEKAVPGERIEPRPVPENKGPEPLKPIKITPSMMKNYPQNDNDNSDKKDQGGRIVNLKK